MRTLKRYCHFPESVSLYTGFVGTNVTLPCKGYQPKINSTMTRISWYFNCAGCGIEWYPLAHVEVNQFEVPDPKHNIKFTGGLASVSLSNGALTIHDFQKDAEGLYECQYIGNTHDIMELKSAGEYPSELSRYVKRRIDNNNYGILLVIC